MFKESFKYYKSKIPAPSFEDVLDFNNSASTLNKVKPLNLNTSNSFKTFDLVDISLWEAYEIIDRPGFIYLKNPFTSIGQRYWTRQALEEYSKKPNKLNIDLHSLLPVGCNWWDYAKEDKSVLKKLRWSTLGYHHNWDTKVYSEQSKNKFPDNLSRLCESFAKALNFNFKAEAAIVNYYHLDSTLSGHTDHSEEFLEAPLFSFSFGNSAIFLLGGPKIDEKPSAIFIHSGDVVVMSKESRLSYHAVPRIVKSGVQVWNDYVVDGDVDSDMKFYTDKQQFQEFQDYLEFSRINLNVRQVLRFGQTNLDGIDSINKNC